VPRTAKSSATAFLGWPNDYVSLPDFHRLPYVPAAAEDVIVERLADVLSGDNVAAVFLESLQGSSGGHVASPEFVAEVSRHQLCG